MPRYSANCRTVAAQEPAVAPTPCLVIACDNQDGADDFEWLFRKGAQTAPPGTVRRVFALNGPVLPHPDDLLAELKRRLAVGMALPELIILDHRYGEEDRFETDRRAVAGDPFDRYPEYDMLGFDALVAITNLFALHDRQLPAIVLRTAAEKGLDLLDFYTFAKLGGSQVMLKRMTASYQMQILQQAIDGKTWQPPARDENVKLDEWQRVLLPALEAEYDVRAAAEWLATQPAHPMPRDWRQLTQSELAVALMRTCVREVERARSELNNLPGLQRHILTITPNWPGLAHGGSPRVLALAAAQAGELFLPLRHRHHFG
jgi:hypothetical protein